jgi:hypothetical protein
MAARGFGRGLKLVSSVAGKAVRAVGEGAREGVKDVAKNMTAAHLRSFLKGSAAAGPRPMASALGLYPGMGMGMGMGVGGLSAQRMFWAPVQGYPTYCDCEENPGGLRTPSGNKLLVCHSCATKGKGAADYRTELEAAPFLAAARAGPRAVRAPNRLGQSPESRGRSDHVSGRGISRRSRSPSRAASRGASRGASRRSSKSKKNGTRKSSRSK